MIKNNIKYLYIEPKKQYNARRYFAYCSNFIPAIITLIGGFFLFFYFIYYPRENEDPIVALGLTIPMALFIFIYTYYTLIKPLNRFIIYNIGLKSPFGKNFIYFNDIKSYKILKNTFIRDQLILYRYDGNIEVFTGVPTGPEIKKIEKAFRKKGFKKY